MKLKSILTAGAALVMASSMAISMTACGGDDADIGDRTPIKFLCEGNKLQRPVMEKLVETYNDGQGKEDGVYVNATIKTGVADGYDTEYTKSERYAYNVITVSDHVFRSYGIENFKGDKGYFLNLDSYAAADAGFEKSGIPQNLIDNFSLTYERAAEHMYAGRGQQLVGVPYATQPQVLFYGKANMESQGINIVSVAEDELEAYNTANSAKLQPHGYAEYLEAPVAGMKSSKNLAGKTVYKVFNNKIAMNWEETRYLAKCFTKSYNSSSPTEYGIDMEYWFHYGWSVGGDVMGWNGESYDFTLTDKTPNYLVTAKDGVTVNNVKYGAGEIVRYEDKVNQSGIADMAGLTKLPSQYDAVCEFVRQSVEKGKSVDSGVNGYAIAVPDSGDISTRLRVNKTVLGVWSIDASTQVFAGDLGANFDMAPLVQYRAYKGGSVYYDGDESFANEYLKVIGEDGYTGELEVVDGTKVVGVNACSGKSYSLVIPSCSDSAKYQASWDFISWTASAEGQKIIAECENFCPIQIPVAMSADYAAKTSNTHNNYAPALAMQYVEAGDWGFFESGKWVNDWSEDFNKRVRYGSQTLSVFTSNKNKIATDALNDMTIIIKGHR